MSKLIELDIIKNDLLKTISEKFSIPYDDLIIELNNIKRVRITNSKYSCNHNFFSVDNELSFYWAGFIAADGCAYKRGNSKTLSLSLAEKDLDHLLRFKTDINFDGMIHKSISKHSQTNPKWNDSIKRSLQISSPQIFTDLERFNIVPNKTKIYTLPDWIKIHPLVHHFMRGYVDGDGSFYLDKKRNRICFELRGNKQFLISFQEILENSLTIKSKVNVTTPDSTSKIKYSGIKIMPEIIEFLYKNASIYMNRKYMKAKGIE